MPTTYKLTYFNGRGRAETTRLIFTAAGVKFEDNRIEGKDWPNLKPKTPWGSLPLLEIDGGKKVLAQSMAIARYVARETGLDGKTSLEKAQADSVVDAINDMSEAGVKLGTEKDKNKKAELEKEFSSKTAPTLLGSLETFLSNNNGGAGFLVGNSVTWADLHFYAIMERFTEMKLLDSYPLLNGLFQRLAEQPRIKEYLKNRPETPF